MILVDTSVWIDHLYRRDLDLVEALGRSQVVQHPMVIGDLALGTLRDRTEVLGLISNLPSAPIATHVEISRFIETHRLYGQELSLVDVHLLAATRLAAGTALWTRDKRLLSAAQRMGLAHVAEERAAQ